MSTNSSKQEQRTLSLKNEQTRQRWDLFHRAIAHAKQNNVSAMEDAAVEADVCRVLQFESLTP